MKTVAIINYKGGVGKTTLTANLSAELAFRGKKVLVVDLDPQASLTFSFISVEEWRKDCEKSKTIKNWYDAFIDRDTDLDLSQLIITPKRVNSGITGRVDLICSHLELINIDLELAARFVGSTERDLRNNQLRVLSRLRQGLASISADEYEFVIIDCPPNFNIVTKNAIVACDRLLIPTKPDYLSTLGISQLQKHVSELQGSFNKFVGDSGSDQWEAISPSILGVVFTMVGIRKGGAVSAEQPFIEEIKKLGIPCWDTLIRENKTIYADAPAYGVPVVLKRVSGKTYENVQDELEELAAEFIRKVR